MSRGVNDPLVHEEKELLADDQAEPSRRQFLRQLAMAGAGVAGLSLLGERDAVASQQTENILGVYDINYSLVQTTLRVESQSGVIFVGRFADGSPISGTVSGASPGTITLCFTRTAGDGSIQIFVGGVSARTAAAGKDVLLAGTFYNNGSGPFPWVATGTIRG